MKPFGRSKRIHEEAVKRADHYKKAEKSLLEILIEVDTDRTFEKFELTHLTPYCVDILGLSPDVAATFVRVVRKSHHVPELAHAVVKGELPLYKAKTIVPVITPENKDEWITKAKTLSKAKLTRAVAGATGIDTKLVGLEMTLDDIEMLKRNQELLSAKIGKMASREEAIRWAMNTNLDKHDPVRKADRSRDRSEIQQVDHRDRGECQYILPDGTTCGEKKWTHHHHVIHRSQGGPDTAENLITLCSGHHRMIHREH